MVNLQLGLWRRKDCESRWSIVEFVFYGEYALGLAKEVVGGACVAQWVMHDGDLICMSRGLRHVRRGSVLPVIGIVRVV